MQYITHRRFKAEAACGVVNLPYGTEIEERGGWLFHGERPLCMATSENAHQYFARNDDGEGLERGKLTQKIQEALRLRDNETPEERSERWAVVWEDETCRKYRREEHTDYWLWNHAFFNAPTEDLRHIAAIVGARKGK